MAHSLSFSQASQITKSVQSEQLDENHIHIKQVYTPPNLVQASEIPLLMSDYNPKTLSILIKVCSILISLCSRAQY